MAVKQKRVYDDRISIKLYISNQFCEWLYSQIKNSKGGIDKKGCNQGLNRVKLREKMWIRSIAIRLILCIWIIKFTGGQCRDTPKIIKLVRKSFPGSNARRGCYRYFSFPE